MPLDDALNLLGEIRLNWSQQLNPSVVKLFGASIATIWSVPESGIFPVRPIENRAGLDGQTLVLRASAQQQVMSELRELGGGTIIIDINCEFLRDEKDQPASSSLGPLMFGSAAGLTAGGLMRLWITVVV